MGPGGNVGQLTEHRPRWTGAHETVQSSPDTKQKCNKKAQTDTGACREGAGAAGSGCCTEPDPSESKNKGCKSGSVSRAPDLAKDLVPESVSGSVSNSHTDKVTATCLEPVTAEVQDVETADGPEAAQARKFSVDANPETARPRRESTGEHRSQRKSLKYNNIPPPPTQPKIQYIRCSDFHNKNKRVSDVLSILQGQIINKQMVISSTGILQSKVSLCKSSKSQSRLSILSLDATFPQPPALGGLASVAWRLGAATTLSTLTRQHTCMSQEHKWFIQRTQEQDTCDLRPLMC